MADEADRGDRDQIEALGSEVFGDRFEALLQTPRRSLGWETPAALIERGDYAPVLAVLVKLADGNYS
jgi:hypothetical protein